MRVSLLKSKIHCAYVTEANLHYMGSITIDEALMEAADLLPYEHVHVVNNNNGERIETYVNGAAARKFQVGDEVIIMSFGEFSAEEAAQFKPTVVFPDRENRLAGA